MRHIHITQWQLYLYMAPKHREDLAGISFDGPSRYSKYAGAVNVFGYNEMLKSFLDKHEISYRITKE